MTAQDVKILLVDDEVQFVDTLAERLSMLGLHGSRVFPG